MFHTESELLKYKISNYDSFEYSKLLECPNCGRGTVFPTHCTQAESKVVGWCETPQGLMVIHECPSCGYRYRFHGRIGDKFDYYSFLEDFSLSLHIQENKYNRYDKRRI